MDFEQVLALRQTAPLATVDDNPTHLTLVKDRVHKEEIRLSH